jgi:hypothetical protein
MRQIVDAPELERLLAVSRVCRSVDSAREHTTLRRLAFDDIYFGNKQFAALLQQLLRLSVNKSAYLIVLEPDPIFYFKRLFDKYPAFEIALGDSEQSYLDAINEPYDDNPAEAISNIWSTHMIAPFSMEWFIHSMRSANDDAGHLWIAPENSQAIVDQFPFLKPSERTVGGASINARAAGEPQN